MSTNAWMERYQDLAAKRAKDLALTLTPDTVADHLLDATVDPDLPAKVVEDAFTLAAEDLHTATSGWPVLGEYGYWGVANAYEEWTFDGEEVNPRAIILALFLSGKYEDLDDITHRCEPGGSRLSNGEEFLVLTDEEADTLADTLAQVYLDNEILGQVPRNLHRFFNEDLWKEETLRHDGRGFFIATDGQEFEMKGWYIYAQ